MRYFITILVIFLFLGCTTPIPPKSEYRLHINLKNIDLPKATRCKDKSLKVAQAFSLSSLMSHDMSYGLGDSKQFIYSKSQWSSSPNRAITSEFLKQLRASNLFKSVQISKSRSKNDFILEINIEDFMQYFNQDLSKSITKVSISLTLINSKTNKVFATKTFNSNLDTKTLNAMGGVEGLSKGLSEVLLKSTIWIAEVCR